MKSFKKDKCPGLDGWSIDIFIYFFDIMKNDILGMAEEIRTQGKIHPYISSTYIALIPKKRTPPLLLITGRFHCVMLFIKSLQRLLQRESEENYQNIFQWNNMDSYVQEHP